MKVRDYEHRLLEGKQSSYNHDRFITKSKVESLELENVELLKNSQDYLRKFQAVYKELEELKKNESSLIWVSLF